MGGNNAQTTTTKRPGTTRKSTEPVIHTKSVQSSTTEQTTRRTTTKTTTTQLPTTVRSTRIPTAVTLSSIEDEEKLLQEIVSKIDSLQNLRIRSFASHTKLLGLHFRLVGPQSILLESHSKLYLNVSEIKITVFY